MKPNPKKNLTQQATSNYLHPWYEYVNRPSPPSPESVEKAKFVDKTYDWKAK